jgi:hypothetical protein
MLAFRLTIWYGGVLVAAALLCFSVSYFVVLSAMQSRTDADLVRQAVRCSDALGRGGLSALKNQINNDARATGTNDTFLVAYDAGGQPIASSDLSTWNDIKLSPPTAADSIPHFDYAYGIGHHGQLRVVTYSMGNGDVLQVGITVQDDARVMDQVRRIAGLILVGLIVIAMPVGWFLARRA